MADQESVGKTGKEQTAIGGVFSVFTINVLTRILSYLRHILITTFIGLTGGLDAFFAALGATGIIVMGFGDIFDSIGIPRLVQSRKANGGESIETVASTVIRVSIILSVVCTIILLLFSPFATYIVPGFSYDQGKLMVRFMYLLLPMSMVYLPYHAMGSILRSMRRFQDFYLAELISAVTTLLVLLVWHSGIDSIPLAWSSGYTVGAVYLYLRTRKWIEPGVEWIGPGTKKMLHSVLHLLPAYFIAPCHMVIDKTFGSYLPEGSVSALYYGLLLATTIPSLLSIENIFVTPIAEAEEKGHLLTRILLGVLLISVPVTVFTFRYAPQLIGVLFQRGMFGNASVGMTSDALRYYAIAVPAITFWGVQVRYQQVVGKVNELILISFLGLVIHVLLNCLFVFVFGMGLRGLALGASIVAYVLSVSGMLRIGKHGLKIEKLQLVTGIGIVVGFSMLSLPLVEMIPSSNSPLLTLASRGSAYLLMYCLFLSKFSNKILREIFSEIMWNVRKIKGDIFARIK